MLREDTTARFERIAVPTPPLGWAERLSDWMNEAPPRPETETYYEFSVGKYTVTGERAKRWEFARIPAVVFAHLAETQKVSPVLVMWNARGRRWWWYLDRVYRESEDLTAAEVHARVLELERRKQDDLERTRRKVLEPEPAPTAAD